jgi:hypothetical protein
MLTSESRCSSFDSGGSGHPTFFLSLQFSLGPNDPILPSLLFLPGVRTAEKARSGFGFAACALQDNLAASRWRNAISSSSCTL